METLYLVIGRGGLIGSAVASIAESKWDTVPSVPIPWEDRLKSQNALRELLTIFFGAFKKPYRNWIIFWCAGAGTVRQSSVVIDLEYEYANFFSNLLETEFSEFGQQGTIFYSSSVGGIYGGVKNLVIDESLESCPNSQYGLVKFEVENIFRRLVGMTGSRLAVGRITNVYGCGQKQNKQQGLITQVCLATLRRRPIEIYVPLGTIRNYIHVEDAAKTVVALTEFVSRQTEQSTSTKIICSESNLALSTVLYEVARVFGRRAPTVFSSKELPPNFSPNLTARSVFQRNLEPRTFKLFPVGVSEVRNCLLKDLLYGQLH